MMIRKHQAGPNSANPGAWVKCPAKHQCRNNSLHINAEVLFPARKLHELQTGEKISRVGDLPLEAVEAYINAPEETRKETVAALMVDLRASNEKALKRNPNYVFTEVGYANREKMYLSSHLPPELEEKPAKSTATPANTVTGKITKQNITAFLTILKNAEIKDAEERVEALKEPYSQLSNLTEDQKAALIRGIDDVEGGRTGKGGLFQAQRGVVAGALFTIIAKEGYRGNSTKAQAALDMLTAHYVRDINRAKEEAETEQRIKEERAKIKADEETKKAAAKETRKFKNRIKALFS